jgi:hypothetical protein
MLPPVGKAFPSLRKNAQNKIINYLISIAYKHTSSGMSFASPNRKSTINTATQGIS